MVTIRANPVHVQFRAGEPVKIESLSFDLLFPWDSPEAQLIYRKVVEAEKKNPAYPEGRWWSQGQYYISDIVPLRGKIRVYINAYNNREELQYSVVKTTTASAYFYGWLENKPSATVMFGVNTNIYPDTKRISVYVDGSECETPFSGSVDVKVFILFQDTTITATPTPTPIPKTPKEKEVTPTPTPTPTPTVEKPKKRVIRELELTRQEVSIPFVMIGEKEELPKEGTIKIGLLTPAIVKPGKEKEEEEKKKKMIIGGEI